MKTITSVDNPKIKQVVKLHDSKERRKQNLFIIEGLRAITTALAAGLKLDQVFVTAENTKDVLAHIQTDITVVTLPVMKKISTMTTASGFLALFYMPQAPLPTELGPGLVLAQLSDPGNMGTLMRTAAACNIRSVVVINGVDPWSPKVVQASAGTIALLDIFEWTWDMLVAHKKKLFLYALVVDSAQSLLDKRESHSLLVIGNEAHGLPPEWQKQCDAQVTLPMPGVVESLNAAVAGSIALYITHVLGRKMC